MQDVGYAALQVVPTFKGLQGDLERGSSKALTAAGVSGGAKFGDSAGRSAGQRFGSVFKTAAKAGIFGALALTAGAIKLGVDALGQAQESVKVQRQTQAVLKSTGGVAKVSSGDVGKLANKLSYMAGVDDELVQSGENVLLTFKDIRNETGKNNRIFDRATKVALNMSTALGTDLKSANIQVGKALNDPVKGITALTRVGVTFTDQQKAQITALVKGGQDQAAVALGLVDSTTEYNDLLKKQKGNVDDLYTSLTSKLNPQQKALFDQYAKGNDTLDAQKLILKELGSEFGGSARSQATAADRLKVAFGNVEEKLGKGLLPLVQDFQRFLLRKGIPILDDFAGWFKKDGQKAIGDFIAKAKPVVNKWLPKIGDGFKTAGHFAKTAAGFAGDVVDAFDHLPGWVKKVLVGGAVGGIAAKKLGITSLIGKTGLFSRGGTPATPLFVKAVGGGLGGPGIPDSGGNVPEKSLKSAVANGVKVGLVGAAFFEGAQAAVSQAGMLKHNAPASAGGSFGIPGLPTAGGKNSGSTAGSLNREVAAQKSLTDAWSKNSRTSADYIDMLYQHKTTHLNLTTNLDQVDRDARRVLATLLQIRDLHISSNFDTPTPGQVPNHSRGGGGGDLGGAHGRGVFDGAQINITAHDYKDVMTQLQRRAIRANSDNLR